MSIFPLIVLLLIVGSNCQEYIPKCPMSNERTYHEYELPGKDFYACQWGHDVEYIICEMEKYTPESKCESSDPCCTKYFSILKANAPPTPTPMFPRYNLTFGEFLNIVLENYAFQMKEQWDEDRGEPATPSPDCLKAHSTTPKPETQRHRSLIDILIAAYKEYSIGYNKQFEKSSSSDTVTPPADKITNPTTPKPMFTRFNLSLMEFLQTVADDIVETSNRRDAERKKAERELAEKCPIIYPSPKPRVIKTNITFFGFLRDATIKYFKNQALEEQSATLNTDRVTPTFDENSDSRKFAKRSSRFDETSSNDERDKATSNLEPTSSTVFEINLDSHKTKVPTSEPIKDENASTSNVENSEVKVDSTKLEIFTRKVIIPSIKEIVNDHSKMSKVAGLFRTYFQALVPIATDLMEQLEEEVSILKLSRKRISEVKKLIEDGSQSLSEAVLEILPSIFHRLADNFDLFMDTIDEVNERYSVSPIQMFFKYLMFLIRFKFATEDSDEFMTFQPIFNVRKDIEIGSKIMKEVTEDKMFLEEIDPTTLVLQLLFF